MMKKRISMQLLLLINNTPKPDLNIRLEFQSDQDKFEEAVRMHFGTLKTGKEEEPEVVLEEEELETDEEELPMVTLQRVRTKTNRFLFLTHTQCNVSLLWGWPAGVVKNFNIGYISLNIRGRLLIFGIDINHMDLYPPDL